VVGGVKFLRFVGLFCSSPRSPLWLPRYLAGLSQDGGRQAPASFYTCGPRVQHQMPHSRTRRLQTSLEELPHLKARFH
jgi:hypothetical protein